MNEQVNTNNYRAITEHFIKSEKLYFTLILVNLGLHLFMVVIRLIITLLARLKVCDKIDDCCKEKTKTKLKAF